MMGSKAATQFVQSRSQKRKLISFLKDELLNNPLAIRMAAYQMASDRIDIDKLNVFDEELRKVNFRLLGRPTGPQSWFLSRVKHCHGIY